MIAANGGVCAHQVLLFAPRFLPPMPYAWIKRLLPKVLMLFSLGCACFAYGLLAARYNLFPYQVVRDAETAAIALAQVAQPVKNSPVDAYARHVLVPTATSYDPAAGQEPLLVTGGAGHLTDYCETGCLAWLMDRDGKILHTWKYDPTLWDDLQQVTRLPGVSSKPYPVGIHLFDDGGLLVTYQELNTFPYAIGLARFDVNSNVLWKKELLAHHWFSVASDGRIFVPGMRVVDSPIPIAGSKAKIDSSSGKIYSDLVLILDPDGNVLDEISMLDAIFESGWGGLLTSPNEPCRSPGLYTDDPLHLNQAQLVGDQVAKSQPWLSPYDLLVSFRNINTVGILDTTSRRFKWLSCGAATGQHSPKFYDDGVLILDNLGGDKESGGTRLVKVGLGRELPVTVFPRPGVPMPDQCCVLTGGHLDVSHDGSRVLMATSGVGTVWEIDPHTGKVLWEYIYVHPNGDGSRQAISTAKYVYTPSFLPS